MATVSASLRCRLDPDVRDMPFRLRRLIVKAYDRGSISWSKRQEMLTELVDGDAMSFVTLCHYDVPADRGTICMGIFAEPSADFLREIGLA